MKTNFSLLFYKKKQKNYTNGVAPIYIRITVNGKRAESATCRSCDPDRWNCKSARSIGTKEDSRSLNSFLDQLQNMVYDAHGELLKSSHVITADSIKNRFLGREEKSHTLLQAITEHNEKIEALVGREFVQGTLSRYNVLKKHLEIFLPFKYNVKDLDMRNVDIAFLNECDYYPRSEKSCANNYTVKMIKNLGKIINISFENGLIQKNPFACYKGRTKKVDRYFLNQEEILIIADKEFVAERLDIIRDVFLFYCFTGVDYADVQNFRTATSTRALMANVGLSRTVKKPISGLQFRCCPLPLPSLRNTKTIQHA